eukprot:9082997-Pyramimonas_sp.AAC.1
MGSRSTAPQYSSLRAPQHNDTYKVWMTLSDSNMRRGSRSTVPQDSSLRGPKSDDGYRVWMTRSDYQLEMRASYGGGSRLRRPHNSLTDE